MADVTLTAGMRSNLFQLQNTTALMGKTQVRLATGSKVNSALDDPVAFFAAQGHTQRASDLAGRKDAMGEAVGLVNAANNGIEAITDLIAAAKSLAQAAQSATTTTEQASLQTQFNTMLDNITTLATDSSYKGTNLLGGTSESLVVTFDAAGSQTLTLTGFDAEVNTGLSVVDGSGWALASTNTGNNTATCITNLDSAITDLRTESKKMANNLSIITTRQDFTDKMMNTLSDGAANLTNADMNEESANMLMLQTRQALGTTSLSMASQAAQSVLRLF
jgi:flagellin